MSERKRQSSEGATDNSQPLSDIINTPSPTIYEQLDENSVRPVNYQQSPTETEYEPAYDYINDFSNVNTVGPYEELNIDARRPPNYQQLPTQTGDAPSPYEQLNVDTRRSAAAYEQLATPTQIQR